MPTLWSGRFDADPDKDLLAFGASLRFDRRLFEDDVTGSLAWAEALGRAGIIPDGDVREIATALEELLEQGRWDQALFDGADDEDVHAFVERKLVERVGEAGKRLHTGRSRNEQVSVDLRLYLKRRVPALQLAIRDLIAALAGRAEAAGEAVMPSYTHLRRAQPVLVAHFFLAHAAALRRDHTRLAGVIDEADVLPLGSGAIAGTGYALDTAWLAERLGFSRVVANSMDAAGDRDFVSGFLHACAIAAVHLSRLAEDLIIYSGEEFGFFELADAVATGSSLMPQKKNPDPLELVRGKAGRMIGHLAGWLSTMKGLPIGYSKDLQEDKEALFDAEDTLLASVRSTAAVVTTLTLNDAVAAHASDGLPLATDVADYLVGRGVAFRRAHEIVGGLVRHLVRHGRDFASLSLDEWREHSDLFDADITERITPRASVEAKQTPQSTHPAAVARALADLKAWLAGS
jgi:argininosuccinate lyase